MESSHLDGKAAALPSGGQADLAQIRAMRGSAADRIARRGPNQIIKIRAPRAEWVERGRAELIAPLPPAVRADDDTRVETGVEPGARLHATIWCLDEHPIPVLDAAHRPPSDALRLQDQSPVGVGWEADDAGSDRTALPWR